MITASITARYERSFKYWTDIEDGGWQDWFNPNIPSSLAFPPETEYVQDLIPEMLEAGVTLWNHPGWCRDVWGVLEEWSLQGHLIKTRLFSEWLVSTIPEDHLDKEMTDRLKMLAEGLFCEVFAGEYSILPTTFPLSRFRQCL